jgi:hypothetical protein
MSSLRLEFFFSTARLRTYQVPPATHTVPFSHQKCLVVSHQPNCCVHIKSRPHTYHNVVAIEMSCVQPSVGFLRALIEHPGIPADEKIAMQRQIKTLEDEPSPCKPATAYLSRSATPSESGSSPKRHAERSPTASPSPTHTEPSL